MFALRSFPSSFLQRTPKSTSSFFRIRRFGTESSTDASKHLREEITHQGKFLKMKKIFYQFKGQEKTWEGVERTTRKGNVDAVSVVAIVTSKKGDERLVVLKQYRPPLQGYCLELPAGLVDEGETLEEAALRELLEETGLKGKECTVMPAVALDPGLSNANTAMVMMEVDYDDPENRNPKQKLQGSEDIQVKLVDLTDLFQTVHTAGQSKVTVDAKLYSLALGMSMIVEV
eukprot:TRINITY_DN11338_c0_g1_i1.p1 TRINITY_DN11338_c0_g1~~TRINITY_DN11338_c0_g1_i1.p1  ORF type:complete len:230 (+),score=75.00 TRINITY_DN11338_c0_g1_i1:123-812(+)